MKTVSTLGGDKEYIPNDLDTCKKLILKILSPYFSAGRFKDKILFKEMAKLLTKALVEVIPNILTPKCQVLEISRNVIAGKIFQNSLFGCI